MTDTLKIAGYCRISVDEELDRDNTSIENQKAIIRDFVGHKFPGAELVFFEDRDRSGYTFEQREGYQAMRRELMAHRLDILVIKDFSRFSRRNSRGLVELEDLRDAGARIISIGDTIDFPNDDDWLKIQFQFLINEMPVTDTSKKVKSVIRRRQEDGKWICAAPYGYIVNKKQQFEVVPVEAEIVRRIYRLYIDGWGYKKIANTLTDEGVPTPRVDEAVTVEVIDAGFDELYKASPYVVIGHLTKSLGEWNSVRETDGSASQDTFNMEKQYTLVVTEVLKGEDIKANDSITYSLPYRNKYADESEYTMLAFQEPPLNQEMLFFLGKDVVTNLKTKEVIATVYYPASEEMGLSN